MEAKRGRRTLFASNSAKKRRKKERDSLRNATAVHLLSQLLPWNTIRDCREKKTGRPVRDSDVAKHLIDIHDSACNMCNFSEEQEKNGDLEVLIFPDDCRPLSPIQSPSLAYDNDHSYARIEHNYSIVNAVTSTPRQNCQTFPGSMSEDVTTPNDDVSDQEDDDCLKENNNSALNISGMETLLECEGGNATEHCDLSILENVDVETSSHPHTMTPNSTEILGEWESERDRSSTTRLLPEGYMDHIVANLNIQEDLDCAKERRFIVSHSALRNLLGTICKDASCTSPIQVTETISGCVMSFKWTCVNGHRGNWSASQSVQKTYVTNLLAASSVLFSGNNFQKVNLLFKSLNVAFICDKTFLNVSRKFSNTVVEWFWHCSQDVIFNELKNLALPISVSGDGRCDSPGHSAQYCLYTFAASDSGYVIHTELIDKRETALKSANMEKLGCERGLNFLKDRITFRDFTTDAHSQIKAMLKETKWLEVITCHQMDIWHRVMHLSKKLTEAAKVRGNSALLEWIRPIKNHYWHCAESCGGDVELLKRNWLSLLRHVAGDHEWPGGQCSHGPIEDGERKPLDREGGAMEALRGIIMDRTLLQNMVYYAKFRHTFMLESFQNLCLVYAPKRVSFGYDGMKARSQLAAIDHNHHIHRKPARDAFDSVIYSRKWCKRTGQWVAVMTKEKKDYSYLPVLNALILYLRKLDKKPMSAKPALNRNHPSHISPNLASVPAPDTHELVQRQISRYGQIYVTTL